MVGVAVDVQGSSAAGPWYRKHKLTYPTLVDASNNLSRTIGTRVVPNQFYIDERGLYHGRVDTGELSKKLAETMQPVSDELKSRIRTARPAPSLADLKMKAAGDPESFSIQLAAGKACLAANEYPYSIRLLVRATVLSPSSTESWTALAAAHLASGDKKSAAAALRKAHEIDPKDWLIRKQIWAIEHPEKFYNGDVDFAWQRERMRSENDGKASPGR